MPDSSECNVRPAKFACVVRSIRMRSPALATLIVACLTAPATAQPGSGSAPTQEPDRAHFGGPTCTTSAPREVGRSSVRNLRLLVASQPAPRPSTLAVWSSDEHLLSSRSIRAELGRVQSIELSDGMNLSVLAPASEGRFLAISIGALCGGGRARGYSCLRAIGLATDGSPTAAPYAPTPADQQLEVISTAPLRGLDGAPTGVALALVARWTGADITLFRLDAAGHVTVEPHPIRVAGPSDAPVGWLAADGEQVVALSWQSPEDEVSPFVLALGHRRQSFARVVPRGTSHRWMRARGTDLELFYALPRGRVRRLRVSGTDGRFVDGTPTTIEPTDALPADPVFPALAVTGRSLTLTRTDLRGAAVGQPAPIAPASGRVITSWSWDGSALHVVWGTRTGREWVISESSVTCAMPR